MGTKKDDSGKLPKSSFNSHVVLFYPCPLNGVHFKKGAFLWIYNLA